MSKQPVVKPKTQAKKSTKDSKSEKPKKEVVDTSKDEEYARMLQEEIFSEQEESDAALARRLQEDEERKRRVMALPPRMAPGGRPMSATPIQHLFSTLFNMRSQASELDDDENEDTTPAMDPDADVDASEDVGATGTMGERPRLRAAPPLALRAPDRHRRGAGVSRFAGGPGRGSNTPGRSVPQPVDLLPGVRVNPNRARGGYMAGAPFSRRIFLSMNPPSAPNAEVEAEIPTEENPGAAERRIAPPPGLGPRQGTMPPPDGEFEPDLMIMDSPAERSREDNFVHIMRDPFLLMLLLMGRDPTFMVPDDIDLGDYEALWELAERLGEVQSRGMKEADIAKLKPDIYRNKKPSETEGEPEKCSVCLHDFKNGDKCIKLECSHLYHQECVVEWLKRNATCPVCRKEVTKPS